MQESSSSLVDEFVWKNYRGGKLLNTQVVKRFDGNAKEVQIARRVRLVVDHAVDVMNYFSSLETNGVRVIDSVPQDYGVVDVYLTKFEQDIPKTTLAEIIPGFFNSFNVDDTTKIKVSLSEYEKEYLSTDECGVHVECWKDISDEACNEIMESWNCSVDFGDVNWCGGESSMSYESSVSLESVDCLASHRDVLSVRVYCAEAI